MLQWSIVGGNIDEVIQKHKESSTLTVDRHSKVGPEVLSRKWNIGFQTAKDMLEVMTQHGVWMAVHPMSRRLRVNHLHLHMARLQGMCFFGYVDCKRKVTAW
jgi:hypothetical protein